MMGFFIGLLIAVLLLDCIVLILLVLIQLPKKEAGAGLAFGTTATDALFGAGSGTVLSKITRWAATIFFLMAVFLAVIMNHYYRPGSTQFERNISKAPEAAPSVSAAPTPATPSTPPPVTAPGTNFPLTATSNSSLLSVTNAPPPAEATPTNSATAPK